MSLQRGQRTSFEPFARCSRPEKSPSRKWVTKVESGIDDMYECSPRNTLAADLRSIANKYDNLVLKMFNQRSHLRGDILLLKKDAQLLRNEMKCLIVKHNNTTAFKNGYGTEDQEKERVLKAEMVTKEMGQLELALAELMSKYYYLLQQTKTLKEINSLWHIRSVLNSDILQLNSIKSGPSQNIDMRSSMRNSIVKKDSKEIKVESAKLIEKVRWLTKLSHEFRSELHELGSAKMALLTGRSCLENEFCHVENIEPVQDNRPKDLDVNSISTDIRKAELRIIDSLHERTTALDKLTDAFKNLMVKANFREPDGTDVEETDVVTIDKAESRASIIQLHERFYVDENSSTSACNMTVCDSSQDISEISHEFQDSENDLHHFRESDDETEGSLESENEPEEIQVRFIREDALEDTDFRCLQPETRVHSVFEKQTDDSVKNSINQYDARQVPVSVKESISEKTIVESSDYGSIGSTDLSRVETRRSLCGEEFAKAKENFTSSMVVWLRPEEINLAKNESELTITSAAEKNLGDDETEFCKLIEKQFEDTEDDNRKFIRKKRFSFKSIDVKGESSKNVEKATNDRFAKELTTLLNIASEEYNLNEAKVNEEEALCDIIDGKDRQGRFYMAKNFFESEVDKKETSLKELYSNKTEIESLHGKAIDICDSQHSEAEVKNWSMDMDPVQDKQVQYEGKIESEKGSEESMLLSRDVSTSSLVKGKTMTHEDRPVFYDPAGAWKISSGNSTKFQRSKSTLIGASTLERKKKSKENTTVIQLVDKSKPAESLKTGIPSANKTLPRGFKSKKFQDKGDSTLKIIGDKSKRQSEEQMDKSCSTLPRKLKITANTSKQTMPVNNISKVSHDSTSNTIERKQTTKERDTGYKASSRNKPIVRANSQIILRGQSKEVKSNFTKVENDKRTASGSQRPLSRIGNMGQDGEDSKSDLSPRKPASRGSISKPECRPDRSRPQIRNESVRRNDISIYGTLPRSHKRVIEKKVECYGESKTTFVNSNAQIKSSGKSDQKGEKSFGEGIDYQRPSGASKFSHESFKTVSSSETICQMEKKDSDVSVKHKRKDENQNENEIIQDIENDKKQQKMLGFKINGPNGNHDIDARDQKDIKQGGERKAKKTVSEKAANFMHNAFKRMTPDSKAGSKHTVKSTSHSENLVKRRGQNAVSSRNEKRKSFIPVPTLS